MDDFEERPSPGKAFPCESLADDFTGDDFTGDDFTGDDFTGGAAAASAAVPGGFRPWRLAVPRALREAVLARYPALRDRPGDPGPDDPGDPGDPGAEAERVALAYRRMMQYVLFSTFRERGSGRLVLPFATVAALVGSHPRARGFRALGWIEAFGRDVLPLDPADYRYTRRVARTISPRVDPAVLDAVAAGEAGEAGEADLVWFDTGERVSRRSGRAEMERRREHLRAIARASARAARRGRHPARALLAHLLSAPQDALLRTLRRNWPAVREAVAALPDATEREAARKRWCERLVFRLGDFGELYYATSPNTPRVFAVGASVNQLPRAIRRVALAGAVECDLRAAQLAVVARLWRVESLERMLDQSLWCGATIWEDLAEYAGVDPAASKPILKTTVYSAVFGMGRRRLLRQLAFGEEAEAGGEEAGAGVGEEAGAGIGEAAAKRFFGHAVVRDLLRARDREARAVWKAGYALDAWGEPIPLSKARCWDGRKVVRDVPSAMSAAVQSYELRLMLPVLGVVRREGQLYLLSWLHDGATLHFGNRSKRDRQLRRLQRAVDEEASALGVLTSLEVEQL